MCKHIYWYKMRQLNRGQLPSYTYLHSSYVTKKTTRKTTSDNNWWRHLIITDSSCTPFKANTLNMSAYEPTAITTGSIWPQTLETGMAWGTESVCDGVSFPLARYVLLHRSLPKAGCSSGPSTGGLTATSLDYRWWSFPVIMARRKKRSQINQTTSMDTCFI